MVLKSIKQQMICQEQRFSRPKLVNNLLLSDYSNGAFVKICESKTPQYGHLSRGETPTVTVIVWAHERKILVSQNIQKFLIINQM